MRGTDLPDDNKFINIAKAVGHLCNMLTADGDLRPEVKSRALKTAPHLRKLSTMP